MALAITYTPPAYSSVQDVLLYTVSETVKTADPVTYPNYKYIADVYVGGVLVAREKRVPHPVTKIGVFDIGQVVRNYMAVKFNPTPLSLVAQELGAGDFNLSVQVKFGEEYGFVATYNITVDSARTFYNNYNGRLKGSTTSLTPFLNVVASNRPTTGEVLYSSSYNLVPYFSTTTAPVNVTVSALGISGFYSTSFTPGAANTLQVLNLSPQVLNYLSPGLISPGATGYVVLIGTVVYTFNIFCEPVHQPYTLHFLNKYGGFESKIFPKASSTAYDIDRKDFGKLGYEVSSVGIPSYKNANNVYNETRSTYSVQFKEKMTLNSDFLTDEEYIWLGDLIFSPMIYVEDSGYFFPISLTGNDYQPKKAKTDELTNLEIRIEFGNQLNAQYR